MAPEIGSERSELVTHLNGPLRIVDGRDDLAAVPHDGHIADQALDVALIEPGHLLDLKVGKTTPESIALVQDGQPGQSALETLQADFLEQAPVIGDRKSPFTVVVRLVGGRRPAPDAAANASLVGKKSFWKLASSHVS